MYLLLVVLGLAAGLRMWGIGFGLPYDFTYDEVHEIVRALKLGTGEYDWHWFGKGGLYYLLFVEYGLLYVVWWLTGQIADTQDFALQYLQDPSAFYLAGRLTVAVMGMLTCLVVFWIGRRVYDWRVGLGAALIGATAYYHSVWSHYINVDIGMILALWASMLAYIRYEHNAQRRWLIGAGACGGIAVAFKLPGIIVLPLLLLAMASRPGGWRSPRQMCKEAGIVLLVLFVTFTVVSPEWMMGVDTLGSHFSHLLKSESASEEVAESGMSEAVHAVTILREKTWTGYLAILLQGHNVILTCTALLGVCLGLIHRQRWDLLWSAMLVVFLGIMSAAKRPANEWYLLPVMPALWLLSSRAIVVISGHRRWLTVVGFAGIVILPLLALVRQDYMYTKPDTRVLAQAWIEANVPSGAKILMDGTRYRFVQSPPLKPDASTVARRVARIREAGRVSRGISHHTLALYGGLMEHVKGPTYDLYSTVWGIGVEDLAYYVQHCFDYIVISSDNSRRYAREIDRQHFPKSARFYEQLQTDPRFRVVYSVAPVSWQSMGPVITVYKVLSPCQVDQNGVEPSSSR